MEKDYYKTYESVAEYIRLAEGVNGEKLIAKLEQFLPHHSTLLEIGSGPGSDWKILNKIYKVIGSDNSLEFLKYLRSKNPNGEFLELDALTLSTNKIFDGIYSNKVMHHLSDSELADSINRQYDILSTKGIVCHSFWKGEGSEIFKGLFVKYHTRESLTQIFKKYFEIIAIESYKEFEEGDSLLLIGKKIS